MTENEATHGYAVGEGNKRVLAGIHAPAEGMQESTVKQLVLDMKTISDFKHAYHGQANTSMSTVLCHVILLRHPTAIHNRMNCLMEQASRVGKLGWLHRRLPMVAVDCKE